MNMCIRNLVNFYGMNGKVGFFNYTCSAKVMQNVLFGTKNGHMLPTGQRHAPQKVTKVVTMSQSM